MVAMKRITVITATAALVLTPAALAAPASAQVREFEGTVVSVDSDSRSFRLRDEGRTVRIRVTSRTRYERLSGFGAIRVGARDIEATVRRVNGAWVASEVERSGRDRDRDDRSDDDSDGSGRDDRSGRDDSGSDDSDGSSGRRGRGSDDDS